MPLKSKSNSKRKKLSKNSTLNGFIKIQIYSVVIYFIMLIVFSFICLAADLKSEYVFYVSLAMFFVSSFLVGFISGIKTRQNGLITGVLYALPMNLLFIIISLIMNGFKPDFRCLITAVIMLAASAVGGVVSVNIKVRN